MGKEEFKGFVKENPSLLKYVQNGSKSWQDFFEMYDMYGSNNDIWKNYLNTSETASNTVNNLDLMGFLKSVDLDSIQNGVNSLQRVLSLIGDMSNNKQDNTEYKPRPIYKHFED